MDDRVTTRPTQILPASPEAIARAADCLAAGGLVAFPTETVYGLGADATNPQAVAGLYVAKGRPAFNPLIAHVEDLAAAQRLGGFDAAAQRLAATFWPGPLTLVVPRMRACPVAELATAGLDSVALRVPAHPLAQCLLHAFGGPVVAPSANRSGHVSPTSAGHVLSDLDGRIDLIVDGGPCPVGVESTIVACLGGPPRLLRPGGVPREAIESALGARLSEHDPPLAEADEASRAPRLPPAPLAPGMLSSHYAPRAALRLNAHLLRPGEALLAFGAAMPGGAETAIAVRNLSARGDLIEAAANLFAQLRALDASGAETIAVMPVPDSGIGAAINDRLRRAAAPRA